MADYIDRQAAIAALRKFADDCPGSTEAAAAAAMAISVISRLPGPWVNAKTKCGRTLLPGTSPLLSNMEHLNDRYPYCHCGAKMDKGSDKGDYGK